MLGFVKAYKPEMKMKDYEIYKGVYCSLCKALGKHYGVFSRMILSYDFTFLAILLLSLNENCVGFKPSHCSFNPFKKCACCDVLSDELKMSAAGGVIISYYKLLDDISDEKFLKKLRSLAVIPFLALPHKKAAKDFPEIEEIVKNTMAQQLSLEKENCKSIDAAAEPTAKAMEKIFSLISKDNTDLQRMGYCLGKYVYSIDAAADIEEDIKDGRYNPLIIDSMTEEQIKTAKENMQGILNYCVSEMIESYKKLPVRRFKEILENILYDGMYFSMKNELEKELQNGKSV